MNSFNPEDDSSLLDYIEHHGVKGMHWGVRKNDSPNANYTAKSRAAHLEEFGAGGVKRINRRLNQGKTLSEAAKRESDIRTVTAALIIGSQIAGAILIAKGPQLMNSVAARAEAARGSEKFPAIMSEAAKVPYVKSHRGVYRITTL